MKWDVALSMLTTRRRFIGHYIFPGGFLPTITQLLNHISKESQGTLIVEKVENIGGHYARALRLWKENFLRSFDSKIRPSLKQKHPDMTEEGIEVFKKKWEVRLIILTFINQTLGCALLTFALVLFHILRSRFCHKDTG